MKDLLSGRNFQAILVLCVVVAAIGVFVQYAEPVSSEQIKNDIKTGVRKSGSGSRIEEAIGSPVVSKAVAFAESIPVRDMARSDFQRNAVAKAKKMQPQIQAGATYSPVSEITEKETNTTDDAVRTVDPTSPRSVDGALSSERSSAVSPQVLPTPTVSFEGISTFDTGDLGYSYFPPDTAGEAGPNHYVQVVNVAFRVYDKTGTPLTQTILLRTLFAPFIAPCFTFVGHAGIVYDQLADRWIIYQRCDSRVPGSQFVAVSKTSDPTGAYYLYAFQMTNLKHIDSPKFGVWSDGYYMTDHQIDRTGRFFQGGGFFAFDRSKMLAGDPTATYIFFDSCPENINCVVAGALPADIDGFVPPPAGAPGLFALYTATEWGDPQGDGLRLFDFHADFTNPANSTFTERTGSPLPAASLDPLAQFVQQPPGMPVWDSWLQHRSDRLMFRLAYRNFGNGTESLVVTHSVDTPTEDHVGARYYQLNRTTPNGPFAIAEQQTFSPDSTSRWMGSAAMNFQGDTALGFSASSATVYPSIRYAARLATDPPGTGLAQGEQNIVAGSGTQFSTSRRWGYYSDLTVEPNDDCFFWYTNQYLQFSGNSPWQTRIAKFAPRECSVSPRGAIQGTITSCTTGQPLLNVAVDLNSAGAYKRSTDTTGTYAMTVYPGTYSIFPKKLGYSAAPIHGIVVTDGGVELRDFCMMPVAALSASAAPTVTTGNNLVEPNECNSLNIPITNDGTVPATVVSATLSTTTPGVTITSATSAYPNIAANGGVQTNITPFQISTDNSVVCLTTIDLILTVTYAGGSSSPSVHNLKLTVGQPKVANYVYSVSSGGVIPGGTLVPGSQDALANNIVMPFAFTLYGKPVDAGQFVYAHRSGVIEVKTNLPNVYHNNEQLPTTTFDSPVAVLLPYWDDLEMRSDSVTGSGIFTLTTGTAPNRTFQIEWRARNHPGNFNGPVDTIFAVHFHENSDDFDYVYSQTGTNSNTWNGLSATVGVQGLSYGTNFTQYSYLQQIVLPNSKIAFSRPGPFCSQGSGTCSITTMRAPFDFDGDNKTDLSIFRPSVGEWWYLRSSDDSNYAAQFGASTDKLTPGDFTGDGKTDIAFFRPSTGEWFVLRSEDASYYSFPFGTSEDIPVVGNFDADQKADNGVFRPSSATWFIRRSTDGGATIQQFGQTGDVPVVADYDGDGKSDIAIYRVFAGEWWIQRSTAGTIAFQFGNSADKPVQGDYTGDGKADVAIWRPSTGEWFVLRSENQSYYSFPFGTNGDAPSPGDYDGDGKTDATVFRPSNSTWYSQRTSSGTLIRSFGQNGDKPVPGAFVP